MYPEIDFDYRPPSYDPSGALDLVRSEARRRLLGQSKGLAELSDDQVEALVDEKSEETRAALAAQHPSLMSGEYLPSDGIEIARFVLESVTADVIIVLAEEEGGRFRYSVADEYESTFTCPEVVTDGPLTLGELVAFIDAVEFDDGTGNDDFGGKGVVEGLWTLQYRSRGSRDEATRFVHIESALYPALAASYARRATAWRAQAELS